MALIDDFRKAFTGFKDDLKASNTSAQGTSHGLHDINQELVRFGQVFKAATFYGAVQKAFEYSKQLVTSTSDLTRHLRELQTKLVEQKDLLDVQIQTGVYTREELETQMTIVKQLEEQVKFANVKQKLSVTISEAIESEGKGNLAILALTATALRQSFQTSHEINKSLIQANSSLATRFDLVTKVLETQRRTGASLDESREAAGALVAYGMEMSDNFQDSLDSVVKMQIGLGISSELGARLAVTWDKGLKQSVKEVSDTVAAIAANTGLAAAKAAELAIQVGRSIRNLGPGVRSEASKVAGVIGDIAARVEELGGNSQAIVDMYSKLTSASSEGFGLRGFAGVSPGQLATAQGTVAAFTTLQKRFEQINSSASGSNQAMGEMQALMEQFHLSQGDLVDFLEAMKANRRELSATGELEKAYRNQQLLSGEALKSIGHSLSALYKEAMVPLLQILTPVLKGLASLVEWFAKTKFAFYTATTTLVVFGSLAIPMFYGLAKALARAARNAGLLTAVMELGGLGKSKVPPVIGEVTKVGSVMQLVNAVKSALGFAKKAPPVLGEVGLLAQLSKLLLKIGPLARVAAAVTAAGGAGPVGLAIVVGGLIGTSLGLLFNKYIPEKEAWWSKFAHPALSLWRVATDQLAKIVYGVSKSTYSSQNAHLYGKDGRIQQAIDAIANGQNQDIVNKRIWEAIRDPATPRTAGGIDSVINAVKSGASNALLDQHYLKQMKRDSFRTDADRAEDAKAKADYEQKLLMLENNELLRRSAKTLEEQKLMDKADAERRALIDATSWYSTVTSTLFPTNQPAYNSGLMQYGP